MVRKFEKPFFSKRRKSLGQCFLSNAAYLDAEAELIAPSQKIVAEIGAGDGRLSERLISLNAKKLFLIEKDPQYAKFLATKFEGFNVEIIEKDFLDVEPFKVDVVCGNIPYYISSPITFRLLEWRFKRAVLMYQKEFCLKMLDTGKGKSRLSFFAQYYFEMEPLLTVPRNAFKPMPKVDSMLIELIPRKTKPLSKEVSDAITMLFQHRPKTLGASLRLILKQLENRKVPLPEQFSNYDLSRRIFELTNDEILRIGTELASLIKQQK